MDKDSITMRHSTSGSQRALLSAAALLLTAVWSADTFAQTLAEVAKKEAERRKAQPSAGKVYTNKDLPASAQKPATPTTTEPAAPADPVATAAAQPPAAQEQKPPAEQTEQKDEAWWKARITQAREELRRNELFAESLQSRINALTREFALPTGGAKRIATGQQRAEAMNELERVKQDIERGKKQIADIEEEARKASVPPGWLR
jgi:hypothetical protein